MESARIRKNLAKELSMRLKKRAWSDHSKTSRAAGGMFIYRQGHELTTIVNAFPNPSSLTNLQTAYPEHQGVLQHLAGARVNAC
jgi:hypothetical protein